ncbi:MAG TPA: XrtA system polysaccharide deacetylase [Gemmatimonadota bacterium]|nr:XrtA system polysaccharide deacetylase [Gemmatimonadota bacterium]
MHHLFTVDVEEYFHVHALEGVVDRRSWSHHASRVESSTDLVLGMLDEREARGTFFILGWVARRHPALVRRIADSGHEVASHGMDHRRVGDLERETFRQDVRDSRALLEDLSGRPVHGYRAPSFSIGEGQEWALEVLVEEGYRFDSSRMPVRRPTIVLPDTPLETHVVETAAGPILEVPVTPVQRVGVALPAGGGAYFRHLPYALTRAALRDAASRGRPGVFYMHPWEVDPGQPRLATDPVTRLRHYGGLQRMEDRLRRLLDEFAFESVSNVYGPEGSEAPTVRSARETE